MTLSRAPGGVLIGLPGPGQHCSDVLVLAGGAADRRLGVEVTVGYGVLAGELEEVPGDLGAPGLGAEREGRVGADQDGRGVN